MTKQTTPRVFNFLDDAATTFSLPIPEAPKRAGPGVENALPFKAWFDKRMADALAGKQPHLFVANEFFVLRAEDPKKATVEAASAKLNDQFNKWRDQTKKVITAAQREAPRKNDAGKMVAGKLISEEVSTNEERGGYILHRRIRTGKEGIDGITEPGVSIWLDHAGGAAARAAAEAKASEADKTPA